MDGSSTISGPARHQHLASGRARRPPRRAEGVAGGAQHGGESELAWRGVLDDLIAPGLRTPQFLIIDGAAGLERALTALWPEVPTRRCTVQKHRNLVAHAPEALHDEVSADYTDMIYAATEEGRDTRRAFLRKWRLRCPAVAVSLKEAGSSCSPSPGCAAANGGRRVRRTRSNACTRSSSGGSRRRPFCPLPRPRRCCSGRRSPPARSSCAR